MDIKKPDRATLKSYFVKNAMPTAVNFADLVDGMLNQKEDGLAKLPGEPLSVQADGNDASQKKALNFYKNFADPKPAWTLSLNPRVNPADPATAKPGLSIGDADGNSKLFIDETTGNVGVGVAAPDGKLHVNGAVVISNGTGYSVRNKYMMPGSLAIGGGSVSYGGGTNWNANTAGLLLETAANTEIAVCDAGTRLASLMYYEGDAANRITIGRNMGWTPISQVIFGGAIVPAAGNAETAGIMFPKDPAGGSGDAAWIRYYSRRGEACVLELGVTNDADDHIALMSSGNVGVGTTEPVNKLDVVGDIAVRNKHAIRGDDSWLRLNQDLAFTSGVHTPGLFAPVSLNVGGVGGWGSPGNGNATIAGNLDVKGAIACGGKIWIRTYHGNCKYLGVRPEGSVYAGNNKDIWESFTLEMGCSRDIKENIAPLSGAEAQATLEGLSPVKYDYKGERLFRQNLGFIAEEMPDNLASENRKTLSPFEITPVLTRVLQEQQKLLAALQEKVGLLERELGRHAASRA